ncbi:MAG: C69 family dipeptidase, partial [Bacilli bacterium]|nr:C69 family dipeptidase [Bacilli bacterium]
EWICFGSNAFNAAMPLYTLVEKMPDYVSQTSEKVDSGNFYWASRLIGALADAHYATAIQLVERYQKATAAKGHELLNRFDAEMIAAKSFEKKEAYNEEMAKAFQELTNEGLKNVLMDAMAHMKNGYNRADN